MSHNAYRRHLFDTPSLWITDPLTCYRLWLSPQEYKISTKIVYEAMFSRFCQWLAQQGKTLDRCEAGDLGAFLDQPNENLPASRQGPQQSRQRRQYLRQLERVYAHLGAIGLPLNNPAKHAAITGFGDGRDQPTRFLSPHECALAIETLTAQGVELAAPPFNLAAWLGYRDVALMSTLLGAGLKVGNIESLTLNCIDLAEWRIELSQAHYTHRARILPFARPAIATWLQVRRQLLPDPAEAAATPVFFADRTKGFGRQATQRTLHASSIFRRVQRFLAAMGIEGERNSPQTLRNTYAALLIDGGASDDELVDFLGLQASVTARRLRANLALARQTVVAPSRET